MGSPLLSDDDGLAAHLEWLGALHEESEAKGWEPAPYPASTPWTTWGSAG
ncbi:hypothetical protein ACIA8R_29750 [Nonomuraea sp. NPDC051191]